MTDTIESAVSRATLLLQSSSDSAKLDAQVLLLDVLQKPRSYLFSWPEQKLTPQQQQLFESYCQRRLTGEPVAHITGTREFWSLPLQVNPTTLIPRPDTETLVEYTLSLPLPVAAKVLDLGTGTGAIALALASEMPLWQITGVDRVTDAVALANTNKQRLGFINVDFVQSDWFSQVTAQQFDLIVSNPPYIEYDDIHLNQGDVRFEPLSALVADDDGMADIKYIITQARNFLTSNGYLVIEHGYQQSTKVHSFFAQMAYTNILTVKDLANNDRVTLAQWPG
ncbi:peptide chain release factor N(5)-glutamine methyltransferase [Pseudoalteromonas sp. SR44-5]|uniref:peptide chain release factor N(5)-glutamine methyltransferase n=1 Tax=unclassified Pseudoalteromonas TaxID=194690 RepID=UPI0016011EC6|nr:MULTISPECIES: peptide chain release factor N(5)-glutamine methyltransferase [unclassified Pseudoalteromonas]MBB1335009.1 peptide chain release factor N(5)-glutamine methyltransferase [Pseudoalteromonas sp. SR41-6]MBB1342908.1 peptide chain release factor N(5)-glutamine methyltransferase [Pseudoalteromonas sp. SR45-6]MBB1368276.1 peptide chain release factor N(5)-glutamine methyltransferase [Pseudoalteromonas sp. SR44-5]MBB1423637.1 peptide chain release factor N(5)-glutamine methyltransferas